jgi:hypothetical protein
MTRCIIKDSSSESLPGTPVAEPKTPIADEYFGEADGSEPLANERTMAVVAKAELLSRMERAEAETKEDFGC